MRIISNFHDYYDISMSYGIDPKLIYHREENYHDIVMSFQEAYNHKDEFYFNLIKVNKIGYNHVKNTAPYVLLFCDEIFPFIKLDRKFYYDINSILPLYEKKNDYNKTRHEKDIKNFFSFDYNNSELIKETKKVMIDHKCPIVIITLECKVNYVFELFYNAKLADLKFQSIKDPYTAWQDIAMWIGNLGISENNTVKVSDKDRYDMHGFDSKKSFRKMKR